VSSVNRSTLMQGVPIERTGMERPALKHDLAELRERRLLLFGQNPRVEDGGQSSHRLAVSGNDKIHTGFHRTMQLEKAWLASRRVRARSSEVASTSVANRSLKR
jgi:hypothetical protein